MDEMREALAECCKKLRLSASLANRAMTLTGESNQEFLLNLLQSEIANREAARIARNMNMAGFPCRYQAEQYRTDEIDFPDEAEEAEDDEPEEKIDAIIADETHGRYFIATNHLEDKIDALEFLFKYVPEALQKNTEMTKLNSDFRTIAPRFNITAQEVKEYYYSKQPKKIGL